jgi:mRNA-degrading endonuclease RelE of RelBE toxin-antitoxin system
MRSFTQNGFWEEYHRLPPDIQRRAREAYRLFSEDPNHPSLNFKRVNQKNRYYSVRISYGYRALGVLDQNEIIWFWIGPHHEYDKLL